MRTFVFITFTLSILGVLSAYTWIRGAQAFAPLPLLKNSYLIVMAILLLSMLIALFLGGNLPALPAKIISFAGNSYFLILVYLLMGFLLIDITLLANRFLHFIPDVSKFRLYAGTAVLLLLTFSMIVGNIHFNKPQRVELNIVSNKPKQGKTAKIVAISDIHLGISIEKRRLKKYVDIINSEKADLVLIAGDLIDRDMRPLQGQKMDEELRQINAPLGVYAIFGNHEHIIRDKSVVDDFYEKSNIHTLIDDTALIRDEFYIVGRDDLVNSNRKTLSDILKSVDPEKPMILLDHQPATLDDAVENRIDLQISGHTHNGQFFPINLIVQKINELAYGFMQKGETSFYVTSGLGIWAPQYRIGSQSEWVVISFEY